MKHTPRMFVVFPRTGGTHATVAMTTTSTYAVISSNCTRRDSPSGRNAADALPCAVPRALPCALECCLQIYYIRILLGVIITHTDDKRTKYNLEHLHPPRRGLCLRVRVRALPCPRLPCPLYAAGDIIDAARRTLPASGLHSLVRVRVRVRVMGRS